ncbi:glutamine--fructose-6-phosphate transaminase (isomerizing) [Candidatus Gottesmanbacteria bacterium]|nr:glutamine--fructose-6-phosphate transaminase (isomerizing) [Candidatus Gottesmanbacteria bacterium]
MCGIFGYVGTKNNASDLVLEGLRILEYRGYDSWGIAQLVDGVISVTKKAGRIPDGDISFKATTIALGHTRWATHGEVTDQNAHPHLDCTQKLAIIHNGIIENYDKIKVNLKKAGHKFLSETDTEVAIHLIEKNIKAGNPFREAVRSAFNEFAGLNAIIVMDAASKTFVAAKTGSPLVVGRGKGKENLIASDAPALINYTDTFHFVEDGELLEITQDSIRAFDQKTGQEKNLHWQKVDWKFASNDKGKYPHFMLKEIHEQPTIIETIVNQSIPSIEDLAETILKSYGTYLVACGTAAYAALAGTYLFSKIARRHVNYAVGSEFGYQLDFLKKGSLVIALSQSGETIDVIDAIKKAKEKGALVYALVNVLGSTLYRMADYKILLMAGAEKAVASTKAFTAKLAYLILLSYILSSQKEKGKRVLQKALSSTNRLLQNEISNIKQIAQKLVNKKHIYVIGRGLAYPIALEAALKIKEVSYIHAEGMASGELKHGPIALVEKGTPCIAFLPDDETHGANLAGAMEMSARGADIIGISFQPHEIFDYFIRVDDAREATIIPETVAAQLLAYYLAIEKGFDPDKPRNLAKSVVVK